MGGVKCVGAGGCISAEQSRSAAVAAAALLLLLLPLAAALLNVAAGNTLACLLFALLPAPYTRLHTTLRTWLWCGAGRLRGCGACVHLCHG